MNAAVLLSTRFVGTILLALVTQFLCWETYFLFELGQINWVCFHLIPDGLVSSCSFAQSIHSISMVVMVTNLMFWLFPTIIFTVVIIFIFHIRTKIKERNSD